MSKFRRNHIKSGNAFSGSIIRVIAFLLIGGFALFYISRSLSENVQSHTDYGTYEIPTASSPDERFYLPISESQEIIHHSNYSLAYNEEHEQAEWVAYELTKENLKLPNVKRSRNFKADSKVSGRSALHRDYTRSGYTRGHLAPAGDMAHDQTAMVESFYMSNMSPQLAAFNGGIWNELEQTVRDWAYDNGRVFVVTGPVLNQKIIKKIGDNQVSVPTYFYKVVMDLDGKEKKGIGFIIENDRSDVHLREYAVSIDEVEKFAGIDFFPDIMIDNLEEELESNYDVKKWRFDEGRFKARNKAWENR